MFIAFTCLKGNKYGLVENFGELFAPRSVNALLRFLDTRALLVILDDVEPVRIWQWDTPQKEITEWIELVRATNELPASWNWKVKLWSEIESEGKIDYNETLQKIKEPKYALHVHKLFLHMQEFPNKKANLVRKKAFREAALRRAAHYALQGAVIEELFPTAILIQTETPWEVKDPLHQPLRSKPLPIIHPL